MATGPPIVELEIYAHWLSDASLRFVGHGCPKLQVLHIHIYDDKITGTCCCVGLLLIEFLLRKGFAASQGMC